MKYLLILSLFLISCEELTTGLLFVPDNTFEDKRDGNVYEYIEIGNQTWMAENLAYLPYIDTSYDMTKASLQYYVFDLDKYGVMYNYSAAIISCPEEWHLPTEDEWIELIEHLNIDQFNVSLSGWKQSDYINEGMLGSWWTATECFKDYAWVYYTKVENLKRTNLHKTSAVCIRCIKDN